MSHDAPRVAIGSFRSTLAQAEARWVGRELRRVRPHLKVEYATFPRGAARGSATKELDDALVEGAIDIAVHVARHVPLEAVAGTLLAAVPTRELPFDVLIAPAVDGFEALPRGARVGASGSHRRAQLLGQRSDLVVIDAPADTEECLARVERGELDAVIVPGADLERLGLADRVAEILMSSLFLPAGGQGAIALRAREKDVRAREIAGAIDDPVARAAVIAELACLRAIGGGPDAPVAAYCEAMGEDLSLEALISSPDGRRTLRDSEEGTVAEARTLGETLARRILEDGGESILRSVASGTHG
jgi:hydroxymethylbilane synthase